MRNIYVLVEYDAETKQVIPESMKIIPLHDPIEILGFVEANIGVAHFNNYDYPTASTIFHRLEEKSSQPKAEEAPRQLQSSSRGVRLLGQIQP